MSMENADQNFNDKREQRKIEVHTTEGKCDTNLSTKHVPIEKENLVIISDVYLSPDKSCNSEQTMDQNLNTVEVKHTDGTEIANCDTHTAENITNSLNEKGNVESGCQLDDKNPARMQPVKSSEKLIRDTLIHKVNELDISGRVNQIALNNKSTVVLKKETDSFRNLMVYDNSSDDDDDFEKNWQLLTVPDSCSDSESDSNDSIESSSDDDTDDISSRLIFGQKDKGAIKKDAPKTEGIISACGDVNIRNLPPLPDLSTLSINYEKEEFLHMGHIQAIIDTLVTIEAIPGTPAYDLDSYLFVEDKTSKKPLGVIYDVIGPVTGPIYCIRFNATKDIQDLNLKQGLKVFSAPKSQYTHYVFVKELMKNKGTDASWVGDAELPPEVAAEISDEEDEHNLQDVRKAQKRKHGSLERHKQFEKSMNRCNTLNTRVAQLVDAHRRLPRPVRYNNDHPQRSLAAHNQRSLSDVANDFCSFANRLPPSFDPTVPPPGFHDYSRQNNAAPNVRPLIHWGWLPHEMYRPPVGPPNAAPFIQGQNNSANYYTNNAGRNHAAGPSTQPY